MGSLKRIFKHVKPHSQCLSVIIRLTRLTWIWLHASLLCLQRYKLRILIDRLCYNRKSLNCAMLSPSRAQS